MDPDAERFLTLLSDTTAKVGGTFFSLPIAGRDLPVLRERVYGYEIYHQLRSVWPNDWRFALHGEVDKRGHPVFKRMAIANAIPDLLVHRPGHMQGNLVVVEIKPSDAPAAKLVRDLDKLAAFCVEAEYHMGVLLLFGDAVDRSTVDRRCTKAIAKMKRPVDSSSLTVLWQSRPFARAETVFPPEPAD